MNTQNTKIKYMVYMAMFVAIQLVLEPMTKITEMPHGGNIAFSLIALFLASYLLGPIRGCSICSRISNLLWNSISIL